MNTLESILKELISARVEQLTHDAEELISMARSCDIPVYEYCYLAGLVDGMHLKETLEQLKTP